MVSSAGSVPGLSGTPHTRSKTRPGHREKSLSCGAAGASDGPEGFRRDGSRYRVVDSWTISEGEVMTGYVEEDFDRDTSYIEDRITRDGRDPGTGVRVWPVEPDRYRL